MLSVDSEFGSLLQGIVRTAEIPFKNVAFVEGSLGHLRLQLCDDIPVRLSPNAERQRVSLLTASFCSTGSHLLLVWTSSGPTWMW